MIFSLLLKGTEELSFLGQIKINDHPFQDINFILDKWYSYNPDMSSRFGEGSKRILNVTREPVRGERDGKDFLEVEIEIIRGERSGERYIVTLSAGNMDGADLHELLSTEKYITTRRASSPADEELTPEIQKILDKIGENPRSIISQASYFYLRIFSWGEAPEEEDPLTPEEHVTLFDYFWENNNIDLEFPESLKRKILATKDCAIHLIATGHLEIETFNNLKRQCDLTPEEERFLWKVFHRKYPGMCGRRAEDLPEQAKNIITEKIESGKKVRILDLGCGPYGEAIRGLKKEYGGKIEAFGIDLEICERGEDGVDLTEGDIRNLPYKDDHFDLIYELAVLTYFQADEQGYKKIIGEIIRVLKPGGKFVLSITTKERQVQWIREVISDLGGTAVIDNDILVKKERTEKQEQTPEEPEKIDRIVELLLDGDNRPEPEEIDGFTLDEIKKGAAIAFGQHIDNIDEYVEWLENTDTFKEAENLMPYLQVMAAEVLQKYPEHRILVAGRDASLFYDIFSAVLDKASFYEKVRMFPGSRWFIDRMKKELQSNFELYAPIYRTYLRESFGITADAIKSGQKFILIDSGFYGSIGKSLHETVELLYGSQLEGIDPREAILVENVAVSPVQSYARPLRQDGFGLDREEAIRKFPRSCKWIGPKNWAVNGNAKVNICGNMKQKNEELTRQSGEAEWIEVNGIASTLVLAIALQLLPYHHRSYAFLENGRAVPPNDKKVFHKDIDGIVHSNNTSIVNPIAAMLIQKKVLEYFKCRKNEMLTASNVVSDRKQERKELPAPAAEVKRDPSLRETEKKLREGDKALRRLIPIIKANLEKYGSQPIDIVIDMSLIPEEGFEDTVKVWAYLILLWHDVKNVNFRFEATDSLGQNSAAFVQANNAEKEARILDVLKSEIESKAYMAGPGVSADEFFSRRVTFSRRDNAIEVFLWSKKHLEWMQDQRRQGNESVRLGEEQYPVALDDTTKNAALMNFGASLAVGLFVGLLASAKTGGGEEKMSESLKAENMRLLRSMCDLYKVWREDLNITENTLIGMVWSDGNPLTDETDARLNLAITLALPPFTRMAVDKLHLYDRLQDFVRRSM
ncbi:MAG: class I SAM-dependent methyltransferase [Candidatus Omnitrophica bacterium]|nr:class I SAM-dependent methyltransferase [Candidatus Omnitrophota bacterium]